MTDFTDVLRAEAAQLADQYLPSADEVRGFVGALANHVVALEDKLRQALGDTTPAPAATRAPAAASAPDPHDVELEQARAELEAAQAKVAQLTQGG